MQENDSFFEEDDKSKYNESINIPTFSLEERKKYKKIQYKIIKKNDKGDPNDFAFFHPNNSSKFGNINDIGNELKPDLGLISNIMLFDKDKEKNLDMLDEKSFEKSKKQHGRKKKNSTETGKHNKYSGDNIIRKCKGVILHSLYILINHIIAENYKNEENYNVKSKKLLKINQFQIINSDVEFNKSFINKKLMDIFSEDITLRCSTYNLDHNKKLIKSLMNEKDQEKRNLFNKIFNLTFLDCLKHFRGSQDIEELKDLTKYEDVCKNFEQDEDYLYSFKFYIDNYEKIMENKKSRAKKNEKKKAVK